MKFADLIMIIISVISFIYCICIIKTKTKTKIKEIKKIFFSTEICLFSYIGLSFGNILINGYSTHINNWTLENVGYFNYYLVQSIIFFIKVILPYMFKLSFWITVIFFIYYILTIYVDRGKEDNE